jgi:mycothiol synthase
MLIPTLVPKGQFGAFMSTLRPFAAATDYIGLAAVIAAVWPDRDASLSTLQHFDQTHSNGFFFQRFVLEQDGQMIAYCDYGEPADSYRPGKYWFELAVLPTQQGRGFGSALYERMERELRQRAQPLTMLTCKAREDQPAALRFLHKRGYQQVMRSHLASLDVAAFDPTPFAALLPKVAATGIELVSLAELAERDPDWQRKIYELDWECTLDEPLPDTPTKPSFEHYAAEIFGNPDFWPPAWFIAIDGGRYVGMTAANRNRRHPAQLDTFFTATVRSHRRRGLATALKLRQLDYAQRHGYTRIKTDNEEHNPMYQINLALGFRPEPALLFFQKQLYGSDDGR